jgi:flagellar hook-length control protein FliK
VHLHAAQARDNASKTDEASPFALLLESTAPAAKPSRKDAQDSGDTDDKTADNSTADAKQDDTAATAPVTQQISSKAADKTGKTDKADEKEDKAAAKVDGDPADAGQVSAIEQYPVGPQAPLPVPAPAPQAAIAPANDDDADGSQIAAAAAAPATAPAAVTDQSAAAGTTDQLTKAAPTSQASPAPQADENDDAATQSQPIGQAQAQAQAQAQTQTQTKASAKPSVAKAEPAKSVKPAANARTAPTDNAGTADTAKTDTAKTDADKTGEVKPNPSQAAANSEAAKPALQPVQAANDSAAGIAAPQAPQTASAPIFTQHVQVTAQPTPDMPALAVTIAAKVQSGARQFDIRLDPPELGRVDVRLSIDATGKTSAHLTADQPHTLDLLQKDSTSLTRALRDAGLDVSQDGLNFSLRQQAGGHDGGAHDTGARGNARAFSLTATTSIEATAASAAYRAPADGRLDIRV